MANEPERSGETLTDEEIETSRVGGVVAPRRAQVADTGDDAGDPTDAADTGDDAGDPTDAADTGDDAGDPTDAADTGDDAGDPMESPGVVP